MNSLIIKLMKVVTARMKCYSIEGRPSIVLNLPNRGRCDFNLTRRAKLMADLPPVGR
jgi:hypothetical protein